MWSVLLLYTLLQITLWASHIAPHMRSTSSFTPTTNQTERGCLFCETSWAMRDNFSRTLMRLRAASISKRALCSLHQYWNKGTLLHTYFSKIKIYLQLHFDMNALEWLANNTVKRHAGCWRSTSARGCLCECGFILHGNGKHLRANNSLTYPS